jgi:cation transport ATPase
MFIVGLALVALGAVGVLLNKPPAPAHAAANHSTNAAHSETDKKTDDSKSDVKSEETKSEVSEKEDVKASSDSANTVEENKSVVKADPLKITLSIIMAIICWGGYGPFLHLGQMKMSGSRLRPFLCVGIAYFIIAVAVPLALLNYLPDPEPGNWGTVGFLWSFAAGAAGAIGALGIIMAFNFGGKPIYVMPLIFGFAPVVNTIVTMLLSNSFGQTNVYFLLSLAIVIGGAVTVLIFAPRSAPHGAGGHKPDAKPAGEAAPAEGHKRHPFERKNSDDDKLGQSPGGNPLAPPNS